MIFLDIVQYKTIEIPLIQRDYVLGKEEKKAKAFLNAIKKAMNSNGLNMDFVYGNSKDKRFIPIDGQQRLTTLFLIYYYLSLEKNYIKDLTKFSYAVRPSSKDFIKALTDKENWKNLKQTNIKKDIKNSSWYFLSWENDLTVQSIIDMLGYIEKILKDEDINKLAKIQFQFLDLDKYSLGEDLYIKMNARGKQLTDFENFKSKFEKFISDQKIKAKLDNDWLDIFWELSKNNPKLADEYYYNFFYNVTLNFYVEDNFIDSKFIVGKELLDFYENVYPKNIDNIIKILDNLKQYERLKAFISKNDISYSERLYFYSWSLGVLKDLDDTNQKRWQRITNNLINNRRIETVDKFSDAIRALKKLSSLIKDNVYQNINFNDITGFNPEQIKEEELKIKLILNNVYNKLWDWEEEFIKTEKHWYLDGQIGFLIQYAEDNFNDFADFNDFYEFEKYRDKFIALWNFTKDKEGETIKNNETLIHRALLSIDNYLPKHSHNKYTFCSFNNRLRVKNENWRKVFGKRCFKTLLDKLDKDNIEKSLKSIINNYKFDCNDWKSYFINPNEDWEVISYAKNYQILKNENGIYLNRGNTGVEKWGWKRKAELYSYYFYKKYLENKTFNLSKETWYWDTSSESPCAVLDGWFYNDKYHFAIDIFYQNKKFQLKFFDRNKKIIPKKIIDILEENNFEAEIENLYYKNFLLCEMEELFKSIQDLSNKFTKIGDIKK